jgi:hypothetical protein
MKRIWNKLNKQQQLQVKQRYLYYINIDTGVSNGMIQDADEIVSNEDAKDYYESNDYLDARFVAELDL